MKTYPTTGFGIVRMWALWVVLLLSGPASLAFYFRAKIPVVGLPAVQHPNRLPGMNLAGGVKVHVSCDVCGGYYEFVSPFAVDVVRNFVFTDDHGQERAICLRCVLKLLK